MRYMPCTNLDNTDYNDKQFEENIPSINFLFKDKTTYVSFLNLLKRIYEKPNAPIMSTRWVLFCREHSEQLESVSVLSQLLIGADEFPYTVKEIFSMIYCGYTDDEVREGLCIEYRDELLTLKDIDNIIVDLSTDTVAILSELYVYKYPRKLVEDFRPELLMDIMLRDTKYLEKNNYHTNAMYLDECRKYRTFIPHKVKCREIQDTENYSTFDNFVLKTRISDKDKKNAWFTVECSVRSGETKESCAQNIKIIDKAAIEAATKQTEKWDIPLGYFEVSRKWFVNGSVLYRFDLKKELN